MKTHSLFFRAASIAAFCMLALSMLAFALTVSVRQAHAATLAEQIICFVDQQMGSTSPFDLGTDYCGTGVPTDPGSLPQCFDAVDNDNDGLVDMADPDCDSPVDTTESGTMGTSTGMGTTTVQCADTIDNDSDGVIDLADPDCTNASDNTESGTMGTSTGTSTGTTTDAALHVDSIDAQKTTAIANDTYEDGWRYVFHITAPNGEQNLAMRFSDWFSGSSSSTIPVAGNMRVSSAQASSTDPVTLSAANAYSTPAFIMTGDLSSSTPGRQVEVKIPSGTSNETYTTSYGVRTLP
jgi:hypothetical protein